MGKKSRKPASTEESKSTSSEMSSESSDHGSTLDSDVSSTGVTSHQSEQNSDTQTSGSSQSIPDSTSDSNQRSGSNSSSTSTSSSDNLVSAKNVAETQEDSEKWSESSSDSADQIKSEDFASALGELLGIGSDPQDALIGHDPKHRLCIVYVANLLFLICGLAMVGVLAYFYVQATSSEWEERVCGYPLLRNGSVVVGFLPSTGEEGVLYESPIPFDNFPLDFDRCWVKNNFTPIAINITTTTYNSTDDGVQFLKLKSINNTNTFDIEGLGLRKASTMWKGDGFSLTYPTPSSLVLLGFLIGACVATSILIAALIKYTLYMIKWRKSFPPGDDACLIVVGFTLTLTVLVGSIAMTFIGVQCLSNGGNLDLCGSGGTVGGVAMVVVGLAVMVVPVMPIPLGLFIIVLSLATEILPESSDKGIFEELV